MPFLDELASRLVSQGVGVVGSTIIKGSKGAVPPPTAPGATDVAIISIYETGGTDPTRIQNKASANTQRPTASVVTRAKSYLVARAKAKQAYDALDGVFNTTIDGTLYHKIVARQEPNDIGLDAELRPMIAFNVDAEKEPS